MLYGYLQSNLLQLSYFSSFIFNIYLFQLDPIIQILTFPPLFIFFVYVLCLPFTSLRVFLNFIFRFVKSCLCCNHPDIYPSIMVSKWYISIWFDSYFYLVLFIWVFHRIAYFGWGLIFSQRQQPLTQAINMKWRGPEPGPWRFQGTTEIAVNGPKAWGGPQPPDNFNPILSL